MRTLIVFSASLLTACAGITSVDGRRYAMRSEAFRDYAQTVFRAQNGTLSEIGFALDDGELPAAEFGALEGAEERLLMECTRLNEVALRRRDGRRAGLVRRWRAARAVPQCERAVLAARALLAREP